MKRVVFLAVVASTVVALGLAGCGRREQPSPEPEAAKPAGDTTAVAKPDTAPEAPPGFKSIHQLELEEHKKQEGK